MSLNMIDIICLSKNEFLRFKKSYNDENMSRILQNIVDAHVCFNQNYKYVPMKDENYQQKLYNHQKKTKKLFNIETNEKHVYALFNKLSLSNYTKIKDKIIYTLKHSKIDYTIFIHKLLKYTESSQLYTNLICDIIDDIKDKNTEYETLTHNVFDTYINEYMNKYQPSENIEFLNDFDYEDYEQFCQYNKNFIKSFNMLHTIITLSSIINHDIKKIVRNIYMLHIENLKVIFESEYQYKHVVLYEIFIQIEYLLKNETAKTYIDTIKNFKLLSLHISNNTNSNKLKFKIQDIIDHLGST